MQKRYQVIPVLCGIRHVDWLSSKEVITTVSFGYKNCHVNVEWNLSVVQDLNSFRYHINTTLKKLTM